MKPTIRGGKPFKRKNGLWVATFNLGNDGAGKPIRPSVSSMDRNECITRRDELRRKLEDGVYVKDGRTTVEAWLWHWLETIKGPNVRPSARLTYVAIIRNQIVPRIGKYRLSQLTDTHIRELIREAKDSGRASTYVQSTYTLIHAALKDARRSGYVAQNVAELVAPPRAKASSGSSITADQVERLLRVNYEKGNRFALLWALRFYTGARQAESLGCQKDRVDLEGDSLDLSWQLQRLPSKHGCGDEKNGKHPCGIGRAAFCPQRVFDVEDWFEYQHLTGSKCLTRPKTDSSRRVPPIPPPLTAWFAEYLEEMYVPNPWGLLWVSKFGTPISPMDDAAAWREGLEAAGLPIMKGHCSRHTTATLLAEAGVEEAVRMQIMGHSSTQAARIYVHTSNSAARAAFSKIEIDLPGGKGHGSAPAIEAAPAVDEIVDAEVVDVPVAAESDENDWWRGMVGS